MIKTTNLFAETTENNFQTEIIDDALRSLRVAGSVLLREAYAPPWAISLPDASTLGKVLGLSTNVRTVAFHLIEFGHCTLQPEDGEPVLLRAGEIAICFGGMSHRLYSDEKDADLDLGQLLQGSNSRDPNKLGVPASSSLLCGAFMLHDTALNPLLESLPGILHIPLTRAGELHNLSGATRLMSEELSRMGGKGGYIIERLLEVICAEAIRAYAESNDQIGNSWFRGVRDTAVGKALAAIHRQPGKDWNVKKLAEQAALSPSRFAARFCELMGEGPMSYVTKWRMNTACRKLSFSSTGVDQIASEVGYDSVAAFNRAFKKHLGFPPSAWRSINMNKQHI